MHKDARHHGGWEHRDLHNEWGMLVPMSTARGQVARSGGTLRPFVLTRAAFAGSQRFGAKWTGDNTAQWSHLQHTVPMLLSSSVAGISFIGADIGGFFGDPDTQLLVRWYQAAAFQPFVRAHAHIDTRRREPYLFGEETTRLVRDALRQRYRFLPLWYTLFYENELSGLPPMRPLLFSFPEDVSVYATDDQYLVGEALLVHPQTAQDGRSVSVYFPGPQTVWYDVVTAERFTHGTSTVNTPIDKVGPSVMVSSLWWGVGLEPFVLRSPQQLWNSRRAGSRGQDSGLVRHGMGDSRCAPGLELQLSSQHWAWKAVAVIIIAAVFLSGSLLQPRRGV